MKIISLFFINILFPALCFGMEVKIKKATKPYYYSHECHCAFIPIKPLISDNQRKNPTDKKIKLDKDKKIKLDTDGLRGYYGKYKAEK